MFVSHGRIFTLRTPRLANRKLWPKNVKENLRFVVVLNSICMNFVTSVNLLNGHMFLSPWSLRIGHVSIYHYSNMAPRLSGQTSIFGVVFFVCKSPLEIERQKKVEKFAILTRKPRSHA